MGINHRIYTFRNTAGKDKKSPFFCISKDLPDQPVHLFIVNDRPRFVQFRHTAVFFHDLGIGSGFTVDPYKIMTDSFFIQNHLYVFSCISAKETRCNALTAKGFYGLGYIDSLASGIIFYLFDPVESSRAKSVNCDGLVDGRVHCHCYDHSTLPQSSSICSRPMEMIVRT